MPKASILVIDDEEDICELVRFHLEREGYNVHCCHTGEEGLRLAKSSKPDLVLLDIMLPGMNGLDICKTLKADPLFEKNPIVMLSARGDEADVVSGLEIGADDYVSKPFSPRVLVARVRAVLRRPKTDGKKAQEDPFADFVEFDGLSINPGRHEVFLDKEKIDLTATEFRILHLLASKRGWVYTRNQIIRAVHGDDYPVTDRSVDVQITGVRKKLGRLGESLETVRGVGYRFRD